MQRQRAERQTQAADAFANLEERVGEYRPDCPECEAEQEVLVELATTLREVGERGFSTRMNALEALQHVL